MRFAGPAKISTTILLLLVFASFADSQDQHDQRPSCKDAPWRSRACEIVVKAADVVAPGEFKVRSNTSVVIQVELSPFLKAEFTPERSELPKDDPNILGPFSAILTGLTGVPTSVGARGAGAARQELTATQEATKQSLAEAERTAAAIPEADATNALRERLRDLARRAGQQNYELKGCEDAYDHASDALDSFLNKDFVANMSRFETERAEVEKLFLDLKDSALPSTAGIESSLKGIDKIVQTVTSAQSITSAAYEGIIVAYNELGSALELIKLRLDRLQKARASADDTFRALAGLEGAMNKQSIPLVGEANVVLAGDITFKHKLTGKVGTKKLHLKVQYVSVPLVVVGIGVLVSTAPKGSAAIDAVFDGPGEKPTDPAESHLEIGFSQTRPEIVPFTFLHIKLWDFRCGHEICTANLSPGVGVNPNSGSNETEFVFGASFGRGAFYVSAAVHFHRELGLAGGFTPGTTVSPDMKTVPTAFTWGSPKFAIGLSYRLPLK